ncbi:hypothetical protein [Ferrovibrio xuzhouensis]
MALTEGAMPEIHARLFAQMLDQAAFDLPIPKRALPDARFRIDWAIVPPPKSGRLKGEADRDCLPIPRRAIDD